MITRALSRNQRECLDQAVRYPRLRRTRGGYQGEGAQGRDLVTYFKSRTVFALEREGLLAPVEQGSAASFQITDAGRAEVPRA
jgi:hypothetical protein